MTIHICRLLLTAASSVALSASLTAQLDALPDLLQRRLAASIPSPSVGSDGGVATPRVLFTASGDDNAASLLVHPDANGDGVPDVVVGWEIFQTGHNLFMLDGAGFEDTPDLWTLESADGISGGYFYSDDALIVFPDVNLDGIDEVLTGTAGGGRAATLYDGATGAVLQSFNTYLGADSGWVYSVVPVPDVNNNGSTDFALVVGSDDNAVYMVDGGLSGTHHSEIWRHQGPDAFYAVDVLGDADGDGLDDIVVGSGDNADDVVALSGRDGAVIWTRSMGSTVFHLKAFPDTNADDISEVLVGVWDTGNSVFLLDGATGSIEWSNDDIGTYTMRVVPLGDVSGDGISDVAVASWDDSAHVLSGADGTHLWAAPTGGDVWAIDRVDDVTGDGRSEVAFGSFDGHAYLADGTDGSILWSLSTNGHKVLRIRGAPDMDADGSPEVIAGAQQLSSAVEPLLWVVAADAGVADPGPELAQSGSTALGGAITLDLTDAIPGDTGFWLGGVTPGLAPVFLPNGWLGLDPTQFVILFTRVVPGSGTDQLAASIPNDPALDGLVIYLQTFVMGASPIEGASTNRVGFRIGS